MDRRTRLLLAAAAAVAGVLYAACFFRPLWDVDVFWHIKAGQWIVEHRALPTTDIFSCVDPLRPWHTFEWGYEVFVYALDRAGGLTLVRGIHAGVVWLAFALLAGLLWRRTRSPAATLLGLAALLVGFADRVRCRPDEFNLLFMVLALPALLARRWRTGHLIGILGLTLPWACFHGGGVLLLFVLLGGRWLGLLVQEFAAARPDPGGGRGRVPWRELLREGILSLLPPALALATPGFPRGVYQAFFMLGPSEAFIPEWMNTFQFLLSAASSWHERVAALGPLLWLGLLLALSAGAAARDRGRLRAFPWPLIGMAIPLGMLALEHVRFLWTGGLVGVLAATAWPRGGLTASRRAQLRDGAALLAAALLLALNVHYMVNRLHGGVERLARTASLDLEPGEFPEGAADFLEEVRACGGVLNHAPWGGYLLYRLWPCVRVYTDGRGNFSDIETHVLTTIQNPGTRRRAIDASWQRAPFEILVHPLPFPWFDYHRFFWILVYRDETAYVYLRNMPENDPVFARVRDWYAARGVDLSGTRHTDESAVELERRIQRFHGARMLDKPWAQRLLAATVRDASEDTEEARHAALFRRADLYFGLGLHRECQETLALASQLDPRDPSAALLLVRSLVADGQQPRAQLLAHVLLRSIRSDPGVAAKLTGQEIAILNILGAHLGDLLGEPPPAPAPGT